MLYSLALHAQTWNNLRSKVILVSDTVKLDSLSLVPGSLMMRDKYGIFIPDSLYSLDASGSEIYFNRLLIKPDSLRVVYRVFPIDFSAPFPSNQGKLKTITQAKNEIVLQEYYPEKETTKSLIQANGVIARGIGVGNNQNLTMNSNMNLQLTGKLDNNLNIEAFLSDKNLPLQADGYSQQIQAFDQIYIKVYDSLRMLQMGDLTLNSSDGYFMRFNRKLQGAKCQMTFPDVKSNWSEKVQIGAAMAKGTFNRQTFNTAEGVQGPYQLHGANNETYIVVLAGTERVYLDGVLLQRGENADYVMDYNTAEISFTPKNLLTANSRVIVEFEYSDRNYNRYNLYAQNELKSKNTKVTIAFYNESDARNQPVDQELTDQQKRILSLSGDDPTKAVVANFDRVDFNINQVLYKMVDTTVNAINYDSVFVQSYHRDSAFYQVGFVYVGEFAGDYQLTTSSANGKVYQWIAPLDGIHRGNYQPVKILVAPYQKQMLTAKAQYKLNTNTDLDIETAFSNYDKNTFSSIDNADNKGFAGHVKGTHQFGQKALKTRFEIEGQMISENFTAIERFREAEFEREWNLLSQPKGPEYSGGIGILMMKKERKLGSFHSQYLEIGSQYKGLRNEASTHITILNFNIDGHSSLLNSKNQDIKTSFYKHALDIFYPVKGFKIGLKHEMEDNRVDAAVMDSLDANSRKFYKSNTYIKTADTTKNQIGLNYGLRTDFIPIGSGFQPATKSHDVSFNTVLSSIAWSKAEAVVTWRRIDVKPYGKQIGIRPDNLLATQINHQLKIIKGFVSLGTYYENTTAMENRKEFIFVEVAAGKGIYVWNDYNGNKVPELDEFEISAFPEEANYIRVFMPTSDYMKVYSVKWNETVRINPSAIWKGKEGLTGVLSRFSNDLSYRTIIKHTENEFLAKINPVKKELADTVLQNWSQNMRNTFSFNRNNPIFAMDWVISKNGQKILLANGFDQSKQWGNQLKLRWNLTPKWMLTNDFSKFKKEYFSEYFTAKNYTIENLENQITIQWQPSVKMRFSMDYQPAYKQNRMGNEVSLIHQLGADVKYSMPLQGLFSLRIEYIEISYDGNTDNSIAYEMLDGNQPGRNYRLTVHYQKTIGKYLQLSVDYFGRKPEGESIIHTGQMNLSAVF